MSRVLAITTGEPAGIGPDLLIALCQAPRTTPWIAVADAELLQARARQLGFALQIDDNLSEPSMVGGSLTVRHVPSAVEVVAGKLDPRNSGYVLETLAAAADGCLDGTFAGVVTGPVQKSIINDAGIAFSGHTEFFCAHAGAPDVVMLLVAGSLRVALATTHLPLREVADAITGPLLDRRLQLLLDGLRERFHIEQPRVLVAGLNPHAGEGGHLGREERDVIEPVCAARRKLGERVAGPLPADTLFTPGVLNEADAVLAMYHDQGLPVLKHVGFGRAVNVTLGLPFVRTSVDHGTALDLAGAGTADAGSFSAALVLAAELA
ncbi:MAG: 4-hydroxythreonine-4-phosphate dehydrogenase PdxA [Gammaproteobacteria bacterium]|nr:4-hydroxythreonine-4-phosphate dehydrogenase PdxA [Gammaproteobacteria bacterium]